MTLRWSSIDDGKSYLGRDAEGWQRALVERHDRPRMLPRWTCSVGGRRNVGGDYSTAEEARQAAERAWRETAPRAPGR